jgi:cystathionine beta-lyase/cystathionine gamma-synthase
METSYYPPTADITPHLKPNTKAVFCESPGSLTFEVQDIPAIAKIAHAHGASVLMDNTWATPLLLSAAGAWRGPLHPGGDQIYRRPCRCDAGRHHRQ